MKPDIELLNKWLRYDPDTGLVHRKLKRRSHHPDTLSPDRERIDFFGTRYRLTHIIWALQYGRWPIGEIDHVDFNRKNNKIANLREATRSQNMQNRRWNNPNGKGVTHRGDKAAKPWQAQIAYNGRKIQLGFYETKEEAAEAYKKAALEYHGEFACLK